MRGDGGRRGRKGGRWWMRGGERAFIRDFFSRHLPSYPPPFASFWLFSPPPHLALHPSLIPHPLTAFSKSHFLSNHLSVLSLEAHVRSIYHPLSECIWSRGLIPGLGCRCSESSQTYLDSHRLINTVYYFRNRPVLWSEIGRSCDGKFCGGQKKKKKTPWNRYMCKLCRPHRCNKMWACLHSFKRSFCAHAWINLKCSV